MKIVLLPLDERPCNYLYPSYLPLNKEINLVLPPRELLSKKKEVCNIYKLHDWLVNECLDADYALLSLDTLLYGGIVPSRIHHDTLETLIIRSKTLKTIKKNNPKIKIFVNELIMRTPSYSNATEEPDYFDKYGKELWEYGCLFDKELRGILTNVESSRMKELFNLIPYQYLKDLMDRREINKKATLNNLKYLLDGIIDYFIIPQDDCAPFGFTSIDRRAINEYLKEHHIENKVITYPGADEAGMVLISKALNDYYQKTPKVFVEYVDLNLKNNIPDYEDRPLDESLSEHIYISGMKRAKHIHDANMILVINIHNKPNDIRKVLKFVRKKHKMGKVVGIADVNMCNRGDFDLFNTLTSLDMLKEIDAYAGWNTSSNTIGTTIANMVSYFYSNDDNQKRYSLFSRYLEDFFYMGLIRDELNEKIKNIPEINIENISKVEQEFIDYTKDGFKKCIEKHNLNKIYDYGSIDIKFPWHRTFEVELLVKKK